MKDGSSNESQGVDNQIPDWIDYLKEHVGLMAEPKFSQIFYRTNELAMGYVAGGGG